MEAGLENGASRDLEETGPRRIKFRIVGEVQGVGFRAWISSEAQRRGLKGWVRNESDSSVATLLIGDDSSLEGIADSLWQGSPAASVIDVCELALDSCDINWDMSTGFSIRYEN